MPLSHQQGRVSELFSAACLRKFVFLHAAMLSLALQVQNLWSSVSSSWPHRTQVGLSLHPTAKSRALVQLEAVVSDLILSAMS